MIDTLNIKEKIKNKKHSLQFLPKCLEGLAQENTIQFNGKKIKTAYIIDIVHYLILRYYFKKDNLFNLSSLILKEKYGYLYKHYMGFLVHKEILTVYKDYAVGKNARIYKLSANIINGEILRYKNSDIVLLKKYKNLVSGIDTCDIKTNSILPEIKQKIVSDLFTANVEYENAIYYLDNTIQDADCYNKNTYSVQSIADRHIFYHFDTYGRVHTNFTILKSFIRKNCFLINGEKTYEKDLNNSQPLMLSKLIYEEGINIDKHEFNVFSRLVLNGEFYQFLMTKGNIKEKKQCKELIYKTFFGANKKDQYSIFAILFPSIYRFIVEYKQTFGNYKVLAHKLQNMESNIIFNKIIKTLFVINPDINVITIHDSIIVEKKYQSVLDNIFDSIIKKEFEFIDENYIF